jgi:hypothetical protein
VTLGQVSDPGASLDETLVSLMLVPTQGVVDSETADLAVRLVESARVFGSLSAWKVAAAKGPGGRPATFSFHALLVALVACAIADHPLHLRLVCDVMFRQFNPKMRATLGIPDPPAEHDVLAWDAAYRNVRTRWGEMIDLMDPSPTPKSRRLDHEAYTTLMEQRREERTDEERQIRFERLEWFINQLLQASMELFPSEVARQWRGSVGVDATLVRSFARPPRHQAKVKSTDAPIVLTHSADPDAAWYSRSGDHREDNGDEPGQPKHAWGYEATLAISGSDDPALAPLYPSLAVGMAVLHKPGVEVGRNGTRALTQMRRRGHPAGYLAVDRAYSSAKAESFQLPARSLGFRLVLDYKVDQLGVMAESQGFLQIEGGWYCPSIPRPLIDATIDFRAHRIDEAIYQTRLEERQNYRARPKGKPDDEGHTRLICPAAESWPLARCDLKPASIRPQTQGRVRIPLKSDVKASPPPSCSQQSVTIAPEAGAKFDQELPYGSPEWQSTYATLRNTNEGYHGYLMRVSTSRIVAVSTASPRRASWPPCC